ncbi:MAG: hypothetical protein DWQ08_02385 [Proteobacteria bacterium]|nr:MAG: hypothetical protein DWQ08_02385 [Pseudomonadota bacterium]
MRTSIDLIVNSLPAGELHGVDARMLCDASPLTAGRRLAEIVNPVQFLVYHDRNVEDVIVLRTGAAKLDNRHLRVLGNKPELIARNEIERLIRLKEWDGEPRDENFKVNVVESRSMFAPEIDSAFEYLLRLGPEVVVFEGAGGMLPHWPGAPSPDLVLYVGQYFVNLLYQPTDTLRQTLEGGLDMGHEFFRVDGNQMFNQRLRAEYDCCISATRDLYADKVVEFLLNSSDLKLPAEQIVS